MHLRAGFELVYHFPQITPIILVVNIHESRAADLVVPDHLVAEPAIPTGLYLDGWAHVHNVGVETFFSVHLS